MTHKSGAYEPAPYGLMVEESEAQLMYVKRSIQARPNSFENTKN